MKIKKKNDECLWSKGGNKGNKKVMSVFGQREDW